MTDRDYERAMERHWDEVAECDRKAKRSLASDLVDAELGTFGLVVAPDAREDAIEQIVDAGIETHYEEVGDGFVAQHEVALTAREALRHIRYTVRRVRPLIPRSPRAVRRPGRRSPRRHRHVVRATARAPGRLRWEAQEDGFVRDARGSPLVPLDLTPAE